MAAGQIGISVFPNMEGFHEKIRKKVREKKGHKVDIDVNVDKTQLDSLNKDLEKLRDHQVNIKVDIDEKDLAAAESLIGEELKAKFDLDTSPARRSYELIKQQLENESITTKMTLKVDEEEVREAARQASRQRVEVSQDIDSFFELDTDKARRKLENLEDDFRVIHSVLWVDTHRADDEMYDFRDKHLNRAIKQTVTMNWDASSLKPPEIPQQRQAAPQREPRDYVKMSERGTWNVINMWSKTWTIMNDQIDAGINQIYDSYRKALVGVAKFASKPYMNFANALNQSKTFNEFFGRMRKDFAGADTAIGKMSRGFKKMKGPIGEVTKAIKPMLSEIRDGFRGMKAPPILVRLTDMVKNVTKTVVHWGKIGLQEAKFVITTMSKAMWQGTLNGIKNTAKKIPGWSKAALGYVKDFGSILKTGFGYVAEDISSVAENIGWHFQDIGRLIKEGDLGGAFSRAISPIRQILGENLSGAINDGFEKALGAFRDHSAKMKGRIKGIPDWFRGVGSGIKKRFSEATAPLREGISNFMEPIKTWGRTLRTDLRLIGAGVQIGMENLGGKFQKGMSNIGSAVKEGATRILGPMGDFMRSALWSADVFDIGPRLSDGWRRAQPLLKAVRGNLSKWSREVGEDLVGAVKMFPKVISTTFSPLTNLGKSIGGWAKRVGGSIMDGLREVPEGVGHLLRAIGGNFRGLFEDIGGGARRVGGAILGHFSRNFKRIGNNAKIFGGGVLNTFRVLGKGMSGVMGNAMSGITKNFGAGMSALARRMGNSTKLFKGFQKGLQFAGKYVGGFFRIAAGAFTKIAGILMKALLPALMAVGAGILALGVAALAGQIMALAGAIYSVVAGAALMAPALIAAAGVSFAALKIGLEGVGDAVDSAFNAETVEEFEEAMADLPQSVQGVARAFRGFKPAVDEMKTAVQDNLLEGLGPGIESAMNNLFPAISEGMQGMATMWNGAIDNLLEELSSERAGRGIKIIMDEMVNMAEVMKPTIGNIAGFFGSLAEQGAKFLVPLGKAINNMTQGWLEWAESLREPLPGESISRFDKMIQDAARNAKFLGQIFGGIFGVIGNALNASQEGGQELLAHMAEVTQGWKEATAPGTEGFESIQNFAGGTLELTKQLSALIGPIFGGVMDIVGALMSLATGVMPGLTEVVEVLGTQFEGFADPLEKSGEIFGESLTALIPMVENLGAILLPILQGIVEGIAPIFEGVGNAFAPVMDLIVEFAEMAGPLVVTVGEALGKAFESISPLLTTTFNVLNSFLPVLDEFAYYIGEVFVAALNTVLPVFTEHDDALKALLESVKPLVTIIGEGLITAFEALQPAMEVIGTVFGMIIEEVGRLLPIIGEYLQEAFVMLADVIVWVTPIIEDLGKFLMEAIPPAIDVIIMVLQWLLEKIQDVWPTIGTIIQGAVAFIRPIISWLSDFIVGTLIPVIQGLLDNVVIPVFNTMATIIGVAINQVIIPIFHGIVTVIRDVLGPIFTWLWEKIVSPVFNFIKDLIGEVFNFIGWAIDHVVNPALNTLGDIFQAVRERITKIWDGLKKIFSEPITFFIETVVNKGVVGTWNNVMGWINKDGEDGADDWTLKKATVPSGMKFKDGGVLPGYTPGKDVHEFMSPTGGRLLLSGGEAIMRPEWTRAVGGPAAVEQMNKDARSGNFPGVENHRHFARGGVYMPTQRFALGGVMVTTPVQQAMVNVVKEKYPHIILTSATRPGHSGYHGTGLATDWATAGAFGNSQEQLSLAHDIANTYPGSAQLIYDHPGWNRNIWEGQPAGAMNAGTYTTAEAGPHHNHVHWAMTTPPTLSFGGGVFEGGSNGSGSPSGGESIFNSLVSKIMDPIKNQLEKFVSPFGQFGKMALGFGQDIISKGIQALKDKVSSFFSFFGGGGSPQNVESYREGIVAAFRRQGEDPLVERVDALLRQIDSESSGDPNVAQKIHDMNGTGESAGVGLYQFIPSTWAGYRDPELPDDRRNVEASHNAAVRYFRDRHNWNTGPGGVGRGHGWKDGGIFDPALTRGGFFDQGGMAHGIGVMRKDVIVPERVLSPEQTEAFNSFVYGFMPELIRSYKTRPFEVGQAVDDLIDGWNKIQVDADARRDARIDATAEKMAKNFELISRGNSRTRTSLEMDQLEDRFGGRNLNSISLDQLIADGKFLEGWWGRNQANLKHNVGRSIQLSGEIMRDPHAHLEAEQIAKELMEQREADEKEAEAEKAREEQRERDEAEKAARDEERNAILEGLSDDQKELKKAEFEREDKEREEAKKIEEDRIREQERAEEDRINEMKATGEYYYGFKVLNDDGTNPNDTEDSQQVKDAKSYAEQAANFAGVNDAYDGVLTRLTVLQSLDRNVQLAIPAWIAAANGNNYGLAHNIAAAQAANMDRTQEEARNLAPSALFGAIEMVASGTTQTAPFIGQVNSGMTPGQLNSTLTHYEAQRARRIGGTSRLR